MRVTFEEFFKKLLQRSEFIDAFKQVGRSEQAGVRDVACRLFNHFEISERDLVDDYADKVCQLIANEEFSGNISVMETAFCNAGNYLPRKYSTQAAA